MDTVEHDGGAGSDPRPWRLAVDGTRLSRRGMVVVALVALVPVLSAIAVALLLSVGTGQPATGSDGGSGAAAGLDGESGDGGSGDGGSDGGSGGSGSGDGGSAGAPVGAAVAKTTPDDAAEALRDAGIGRIGSVEGAWTWRDGDTVTLLAVTRRVTRRNSNFSARAVLVRATTVVDPGGSAKLLSTVEDPGQTCARGVEMRVGFNADDITVRDLDGDGSREAVVAWSHACGNEARRRATVLAGVGAYALEGQGPLIAEPDPPIADWPDGYLDAASAALDRAG